jgi:sensor histidine kinase regulating citrate/malate metabolism
MKWEACHKAQNGWEPADDENPQDYVWGSSEQAKQRSLSLYLIRSIVEKYGGSVRVDLATDTLYVDVPKERELACAQEIEEQVGSMCY